MTNSNDMPLAAKPIDRAAHRRKDDAWLDAAFRQEDVLILMLRNGDPFAARDGGLVWMGPEIEQVSPGSPRIFLGEDTSGAPVFAVNLPPNFDLENSLIAGRVTSSNSAPRQPE